MPLGTRIYSFPELRRSGTFKGLSGLLADSLPDRYGNELINSLLARNGRPEDSMNPVELLYFIGNRGMCALGFEPSTLPVNEKGQSLELSSLIETTKKLLPSKTLSEIHWALSKKYRKGCRIGPIMQKSIASIQDLWKLLVQRFSSWYN